MVVHQETLWKADLGHADVVTVFQAHYTMWLLGKKLKRELKDGARVVVNSWKFYNWEGELKQHNLLVHKTMCSTLT